MHSKPYPNKNTRSLLRAAGISVLIVSIFSCESEPYRLEAKDQQFVDSVSNNEIGRLAKILEDSCNANFDKRVKKLSDSIVEYQIKLIGRQLDRNSE